LGEFTPHLTIQDPYKPEGSGQINIDKLKQFATSGPDSRRYSDVIYIQGLPWKIYAELNEKQNDQNVLQKYLGCYLECNTDTGIW
jgi:hypothetical protein